MTTRPGVVALAAALAACGSRTVGPVEPWVRVHAVGEEVALSEVEVGEPFEVEGGFKATCEQDVHSAGGSKSDRDNGGAQWLASDCSKPADVSLTCEGPCVVDGTRVTPTAPGKLSVVVHLHARPWDRVTSLSYTVRAPASFTIAGCRATPGSGEQCETDIPAFEVRPGHHYARAAEPVTVTLLATGRSTTGPQIDLAALVATTPVAPGAYELEIRQADRVRRLTVVYAPNGARQ